MNEAFIKPIKNFNINNVYYLKIKKGEFIIRTTLSDNEFECNILKILMENNFNSPNLISNFKYDNVNIMILKYIPGSMPEKTNKSLITNLAKLIFKLHNIKITDEMSLKNENVETIEKLKKYFERCKRSKYIINNLSFFENCLKELDTLNFELFKKSIVHSDIKSENIVVNNSKVSIIDFGNSYIGSSVIDIIRTIMWLFIREQKLDNVLIKKFIKMCGGIDINEKNNIKKLIMFCLTYNIFKDLSLYNEGMLQKEYIESVDKIWIKFILDKKKLDELVEVMRNA